MIDKAISRTPLHHRSPKERRLVMQPLLAIEGNPLTAEEIAMFEMFERECWSHKRRREYVLAMFKPRASRNSGMSDKG
jgi:hypothetical protein